MPPSFQEATTNRRKRRLDDVSTADNDKRWRMMTVRDDEEDYNTNHGDSKKRPRFDFHLRRMEHRLEWALKCARRGNERMVDFYLGEAKKDSLQSNFIWDSTFDSWTAWIRSQLQTP